MSPSMVARRPPVQGPMTPSPDDLQSRQPGRWTLACFGVPRPRWTPRRELKAMRAAVVYESMQGHGREVAHAIGERLAEHARSSSPRSVPPTRRSLPTSIWWSSKDHVTPEPGRAPEPHQHVRARQAAPLQERGSRSAAEQPPARRVLHSASRTARSARPPRALPRNACNGWGIALLLRPRPSASPARKAGSHRGSSHEHISGAIALAPPSAVPTAVCACTEMSHRGTSPDRQPCAPARNTRAGRKTLGKGIAPRNS